MSHVTDLTSSLLFLAFDSLGWTLAEENNPFSVFQVFTVQVSPSCLFRLNNFPFDIRTLKTFIQENFILKSTVNKKDIVPAFIQFPG